MNKFAVLVLSGPQLETARFLGMRRTEEQAMDLVEEQKDEDKQYMIYEQVRVRSIWGEDPLRS